MINPEMWDDTIAGWLIRETDTYWVHVCPMIFNHRVTLTPKPQKDWYEAGWCYPDLLSAAAAAFVWDPDTQERPEGFTKEAIPRTSPLPSSA